MLGSMHVSSRLRAGMPGACAFASAGVLLNVSPLLIDPLGRGGKHKGTKNWHVQSATHLKFWRSVFVSCLVQTFDDSIECHPCMIQLRG